MHAALLSHSMTTGRRPALRTRGGDLLVADGVPGGMVQSMGGGGGWPTAGSAMGAMAGASDDDLSGCGVGGSARVR